MEHRQFCVSPEDKGMRLDRYLAVRLGDGYSRTQVKDLIDRDMVTVDGENAKPRYAVKEGQVINIDIPPQEPCRVEAEDIPLKILYEDEWLIVIDKPAGMVVHPGSGNRTGTVVNALAHHCGKLPDSDDPVRPGIVHRLDKDTSGVMVAAKNDRALRSLAGQFQERAVKKVYFAIVKGNVEMDNAVIDAPVARHSVERKKMAVEHSEGKEARTTYHVVERLGDFTVLRLDLHTGRTHQIRVHMKYLGNPVAGDPAYGGGQDMERQALHAEKLSFTHPGTGRQMEFSSPVPEDIKSFIDRIKKNK
jgi:23S rRNA pseudouridine1911/1915/1917 synthase